MLHSADVQSWQWALAIPSSVGALLLEAAFSATALLAPLASLVLPSLHSQHHQLPEVSSSVVVDAIEHRPVALGTVALSRSADATWPCEEQREAGLLLASFPCAGSNLQQILHLFRWPLFYLVARPVALRDWLWLTWLFSHSLILVFDISILTAIRIGVISPQKAKEHHESGASGPSRGAADPRVAPPTAAPAVSPLPRSDTPTATPAAASQCPSKPKTPAEASTAPAPLVPYGPAAVARRPLSAWPAVREPLVVLGAPYRCGAASLLYMCYWVAAHGRSADPWRRRWVLLAAYRTGLSAATRPWLHAALGVLAVECQPIHKSLLLRTAAASISSCLALSLMAAVLRLPPWDAEPYAQHPTVRLLLYVFCAHLPGYVVSYGTPLLYVNLREQRSGSLAWGQARRRWRPVWQGTGIQLTQQPGAEVATAAEEAAGQAVPVAEAGGSDSTAAPATTVGRRAVRLAVEPELSAGSAGAPAEGPQVERGEARSGARLSRARGTEERGAAAAAGAAVAPPAGPCEDGAASAPTEAATAAAAAAPDVTRPSGQRAASAQPCPQPAATPGTEAGDGARPAGGESPLYGRLYRPRYRSTTVTLTCKFSVPYGMPYIAASEALRAAAGYAVRQVTAAVQEAGMGPGVHVECLTVPGCVQLAVLVEGQETAAVTTEGGGRGGDAAPSWLQPRALWAAVARAAEGLGMRPLTAPQVQCVASEAQHVEGELQQQEAGQERALFAPETSARAPTLIYIEPPVLSSGVLMQPRRAGREPTDTGASGGAGGIGSGGGGLRVRLGGGTAAAELEEAGAAPAPGVAVELLLPPDCLEALGGHDVEQREQQEHGGDVPAASATGPAAELLGCRRWRLAVTAAVQDIAGGEGGAQGTQPALPPAARASPARLLALCNAPPPGLPLHLLLPPILLRRTHERDAIEAEASASQDATSPSAGMRGESGNSLSALLRLHLLAVPKDAAVPPPPPPPSTPAAQTATRDDPAVLSPFHTPLFGDGIEFIGYEPGSPWAGAAFAGSGRGTGSIGMEEGQAADAGASGADADVPQAVWLGSAPLLLAPPGPAGELAALWERMKGEVEAQGQEGRDEGGEVGGAAGRYLASSGLAMQHHMRPLLRDLAAAVTLAVGQGQGQESEDTAYLKGFLQFQGMANSVQWLDRAGGRGGVARDGNSGESTSTSSNLATSSSGTALPTISSSAASGSAARSSLCSDSGRTNSAQSGGGGAAAVGGAGDVASMTPSLRAGSAGPHVGAGGRAGGGSASQGRALLPRGISLEVAQPSTVGSRPCMRRSGSF